MLKHKYFLIIIATLLLNNSCTTHEEVQNLKTEIESLKSEISNLKTIVEEIKTKTNDLQSQNKEIDINNFAVISSDGKGYGIAKSNFGNILISLEDAKPYLGGQKIILNIGNITSGDIRSGTLTLFYGKNITPSDNLEDWKKTLGVKEEKIIDRLRPGYWTKMELIINPLETANFQILLVGIKFGQVVLKQEQ